MVQTRAGSGCWRRLLHPAEDEDWGADRVARFVDALRLFRIG